MDSNETKRAVREAFNEAMAPYTDGAARFAEASTKAISDLVDAFDDLLTRNLARDTGRSELARAYVSARLAALKRSSELMTARIRTFEALDTRLNSRARTAVVPRRARTGR